MENQIQSIKFIHKHATFLIINCFLPSGNSASNIQSRASTLHVLANTLQNEKFDHLILAGDFNMVLNQIDKANQLTRHEPHTHSHS